MSSSGPAPDTACCADAADMANISTPNGKIVLPVMAAPDPRRTRNPGRPPPNEKITLPIMANLASSPVAAYSSAAASSAPMAL